MFPEGFINPLPEEVTIAEDSKIKRELKYSFDSQKFDVMDGRVLENTDIEAVKQWIRLFLHTLKDSVTVYEGTKMGTSYKDIIGWKTINDGFVNSELEREIKEGFPLNPAIEKVLSVSFQKVDEKLSINIKVLLKNGTTLTVEVTI